MQQGFNELKIRAKKAGQKSFNKQAIGGLVNTIETLSSHP